LFLGDRNTLPVKKKKKDFGCVLVFCDVGWPVLWLLALSVVVGIWWMPAVFWVVEKLLCGPLLLLLLLFLYWPEVSVFSGKFRWSPVMLRRVSGDVLASLQLLFCSVFQCFTSVFRYCRPVLCVFGQC
jgi:hypothetical protein